MDGDRSGSEENFAAASSLYDELLWVHSMIRRDLDRVAELAAEAVDGLDPAEAREQVASLKAEGVLWRLKLTCPRYCRFVDSHHRLEDGALFAALRHSDPALGPVIDRLQVEHRDVTVLLDEVEAIADALEQSDRNGARKRLVESPHSLGDVLLAHLRLRGGDPAAGAERDDGRGRARTRPLARRA
jgi:Hemerythrin HHE cation binding domain